MSYAELINKIRKLPQPAVYKNSTEVCRIGGVSLTLWDVITAGVISGLNILIVGEKGEGKTQLAQDVNSTYFGGKGTFIRAHPDLKTRDIYTALNLEKLASSKGDTHEALEIAESIKNPLSILDEINRVPQITQNQALSILDGYISLPEKNENIFLGVNGYHIGIATANLGRTYSGIFPFDPAYLDRSHLIINVDNFPPTTKDLITIQQQDINPRVKKSEVTDYTDEIIQIWQQLKNMSLSLDGLIADLYLKKGLDYCSRSPTKRKSSVRDDIPNMCQACLSEGTSGALGENCGYLIPTTTRSFKAYKALAFGLTLVSDAKSETFQGRLPGYREILEAFRLTAPYSGILDPSWIRREHHGNPYLALNSLYPKIKLSIEEKAPYIKKAFSNAISGKLSFEEIEALEEEWKWMEDILSEINRIAHSSKGGLLEDIKEGKILYNQDFWISSLLHPQQTLFGESLINLNYDVDIGKKIRDKMDRLYGIVFATEDGIYMWYEEMRSPKKIFELSKEKFKKKRISSLAFIRGKLLFAIGNEIYDVGDPDVPLVHTSHPVQTLTESGDFLVGAEEKGIWITRGKDRKIMIPVQKKVTAVTGVPVYKLKKF